MFSQIEVAKPKISHFNGRLFSSLKKSAFKTSQIRCRILDSGNVFIYARGKTSVIVV